MAHRVNVRFDAGQTSGIQIGAELENPTSLVELHQHDENPMRQRGRTFGDVLRIHRLTGEMRLAFRNRPARDNFQTAKTHPLALVPGPWALPLMHTLSQTSVNWAALLEQLSRLSTPVIVGLFGLHLVLFFVLWVWSKRDFRVIASSLFDFTKGLKNQSLLDANSHLGDQIEVFLADVNDVLDDPTRAGDRTALLARMQVLDEKRRYLQSMSFETIYNSARTMIEAYPLAGVLGTMLAIGAALNTKAGGQAASVAQVVERFGEAIWCSFAGLISAIILMFINSWLEPSFNRLSEDRKLVRETVGRAKRELALSAKKSEGPDA